MTHMPPIFGVVDDTAFGAKQHVGYQYSTLPTVIHEAEKVRDRKRKLIKALYYKCCIRTEVLLHKNMHVNGKN